MSLGLWITPESTYKQSHGGQLAVGQRGMFWQRVQEAMAFTDIPAADWPARWIAEAARGAAHWNTLIAKVLDGYDIKEQGRSWKERHGKAAVNLQAEADAADKTRQTDGLITCPRCQMRVRQWKSHLPF